MIVINTPRYDVPNLFREVTRLNEVVQDLSDALRAAAAGELAPAEAFVAAGVLGIRDLDRGGIVLSFSHARVEPHEYAHAPQSLTVRANVPGRDGRLFVRRLYVEPALAPHFQLVGFYEDFGRTRLLGSGQIDRDTVPCELFTKRYGPPRFDWSFADPINLELEVINTSDHPLPFRLLALGYYGYGCGYRELA